MEAGEGILQRFKERLVPERQQFSYQEFVDTFGDITKADLLKQLEYTKTYVTSLPKEVFNGAFAPTAAILFFGSLGLCVIAAEAAVPPFWFYSSVAGMLASIPLAYGITKGVFNSYDKLMSVLSTTTFKKDRYNTNLTNKAIGVPLYKALLKVVELEEARQSALKKDGTTGDVFKEVVNRNYKKAQYRVLKDVVRKIDRKYTKREDRDKLGNGLFGEVSDKVEKTKTLVNRAEKKATQAPTTHSK